MILQSACRKEWFVQANIARGFIGLPIGSRIPTISEYAEDFSCSRGIVQNALAELEAGQTILLDRLGKKGTYLVGKEDRKLFQVSGLHNLTASMPPPINRHFAGLATGICQGMTACPVPFTFAFQQGAKNRVQALLNGAYDFVVTTKFSADLYASKYPEVKIAFPFDGCEYALPHKLYINKPGKRQIEDGMTIAVDPSSYDQVAITRRLCEGKNVTIREMPFVSAMYAFYTGKIDCLVFRDGIENSRDNLLNLVLGSENCVPVSQISSIPLPWHSKDMERPVALVHRDNYGIKGILGNYLFGEQVAELQKQVINGTKVPQFY